MTRCHNHKNPSTTLDKVPIDILAEAENLYIMKERNLQKRLLMKKEEFTNTKRLSAHPTIL